MCLSVAGRIVRIQGDLAEVDVDGAPAGPGDGAGPGNQVSLALLALEGTPVAPGDWVLVHTGFAVSVLDPDDAAAMVDLRRQMRSTDPTTHEVQP